MQLGSTGRRLSDHLASTPMYRNSSVPGRDSGECVPGPWASQNSDRRSCTLSSC